MARNAVVAPRRRALSRSLQLTCTDDARDYVSKKMVQGRKNELKIEMVRMGEDGGGGAIASDAHAELVGLAARDDGVEARASPSW